MEYLMNPKRSTAEVIIGYLTPQALLDLFNESQQNILSPMEDEAGDIMGVRICRAILDEMCGRELTARYAHDGSFAAITCDYQDNRELANVDWTAGPMVASSVA